MRPQPHEPHCCEAGAPAGPRLGFEASGKQVSTRAYWTVDSPAHFVHVASDLLTCLWLRSRRAVPPIQFPAWEARW